MSSHAFAQEFTVNSTVLGNQHEASVTALADGRFVVTWYSPDFGGGSGVCIRARIYGADGTPAAADFVVSSTLPVFDVDSSPAVTRLPDGGFVIAWESYVSPGDGSTSCIRARAFLADGSPAGLDFIANTTAYGPQIDPSVTALPDGRFVVAWQSNDPGDGSGVCIRARLFAANGVAIADDFIVNSTGPNNQTSPVIAAQEDGRFLAMWSSFEALNAAPVIRARLFEGDGGAVGSDFVVNSSATTSAHPSALAGGIAALEDGRFVVTWADGSDPTTYGIRARLLDSNGIATGSEISVKSSTETADDNPSVAALVDGGFIVTWRSGQQTGSHIRSRIYGPDGVARGSDFVVSTHDGGQFEAAVAALPNGDVVVSWESTDPGDGSGHSILARIFDPARPPGDDLFYGTSGADNLSGGTGSDWYLVNDSGDIVQESVGGGVLDRIFAMISYTLPDGTEIENFSTADHAGMAPTDLTGNEFGNLIYGNAGDNTLNGLDGADTLVGLEGDDTLNGGFDSDTLVGGPGNDQLNGNEGDDLLYGQSGLDLLAGGTGNDWYFVADSNAAITEIAGQGMLDRVFATESYTLTAGAEIEIFSTADHAGTAPLNLTGNEHDSIIFGNAGSNALKGMLGNDVLAGLGGADAFVFNTALDGSANVDLINDFVSGEDRIVLASGIFTSLPLGALAATAFRMGAVAQDGDDRIIHDAMTGHLSYDPDGANGAPAIQFAVLHNGTAATAGDFLVF